MKKLALHYYVIEKKKKEEERKRVGRGKGEVRKEGRKRKKK